MKRKATLRNRFLLKVKTIKVKQILRFLVGGGSAVITDYLIYKILLSTGIQLDQAKAISFICGATVGFVINKLWTFEVKAFSTTEILRYIALYVVTATLNILVNRGVLFLFNVQVLAFLCATGVSTVLNFIGQKFFVFRI